MHARHGSPSLSLWLFGCVSILEQEHEQSSMLINNQLYSRVFIVTFLFVPLPGYRGYSNLTSVPTPEELDALIESTRTSTSTGNATASTSSNRRKGKTPQESATDKAGTSSDRSPAVVVMYAAIWAPASRYFETTFAQLSLKYASEQLKFAVVNVDLSQEMTDKYNINVTSTTLEMPTIVLYRDGKESARLPSRTVSTAARLAWNRSYDSVVKAFELDSYLDHTSATASSRTPLIG
ncbi:hypothetical protein BDF22DRAFT_682074 [Syncephalis plumigaleata]|nr:hypothetical protein BDF22DRAFT_682074 [Syncephalis plumigaleata]